MIRTLKVAPLGRTGGSGLAPAGTLPLKEVPDVIALVDVGVVPALVALADVGVVLAAVATADVDVIPVAVETPLVDQPAGIGCALPTTLGTGVILGVTPCVPCNCGVSTEMGRMTVALAMLPWVKVEVVAGVVDKLAVCSVRAWLSSGIIST